ASHAVRSPTRVAARRLLWTLPRPGRAAWWPPVLHGTVPSTCRTDVPLRCTRGRCAGATESFQQTRGSVPMQIGWRLGEGTSAVSAITQPVIGDPVDGPSRRTRERAV